jgi:succinyl-diaminopimelate desuccinylase
MSLEIWKEQVWAYIDSNRPRWLDLVREIIHRPSDNPPGNTSELANYIKDVLQHAGLPVEWSEPLPGAVNLVSSLSSGQGPHLVLNGHLDVFPVEDPKLWSHDPYSGEVYDGHIYGRGSGDMKSGTTALLSSFLIMHALKVPLRGRLTLMLVSDEETGGRWGTHWLLQRTPSLAGDAVLSAEPSTPQAVNIAEKGTCWIRVRTQAPGGHGGLGKLGVDENAIIKMQSVFLAAQTVVGRKGQLPEMIQHLVESSKASLEQQRYGRGHSSVLDSISLNIGRIQGGAKINVVPVHCEAELDYRMPMGYTATQVHDLFRKALDDAAIDGVESEIWLTSDPSYTPPEAAIVSLTQTNAQTVTGKRPGLQISYGATDCRFFRYMGKPAAIYGPRVNNMGAPNETITVEDFFTVMKVHAATIIDFMGLR